MLKNDDNTYCLVKFMHSEGPSPSFHWPQKSNVCWIEMESILKKYKHRQQGKDIGTSDMKTYRRA
jgi:hypothetical protein